MTTSHRTQEKNVTKNQHRAQKQRAARRHHKLSADRLRLIVGIAFCCAVIAVVALALVPASSNGSQQISAGSRPTSSTSSSTTSSSVPTPPYSNPSIKLANLAFTASKATTAIPKSYLIKNTSSDLPTNIMVVQQQIKLEYKTSSTKKYTTLPDPTCTYDPAAPFTIPFQQQRSVTFACTIAAPLPSTTKFVRLTTIVNLQSRALDFTIKNDQAI